MHISTGSSHAPWARRAILLGLALLAAGCASRPSLPALFGPRIALSDLRLDVARDANDNMPLRIELVAAGDEQLLARLLELSAAQWFDPLANYRRDYPATLRSTGLRTAARRDPAPAASTLRGRQGGGPGPVRQLQGQGRLPPAPRSLPQGGRHVWRDRRQRGRHAALTTMPIP
ncbi:hypothetical protein [Massilia sp. Se16.2.3]|uniref:hypothetical protein n=1 Tax=Massilia sp. Se16.2.3 TaxID=2709303 RepID=UPI0015FFAF50|nr:hypothetical protein [Massilia sp. Se16.2.3]QNB00143.1 hypothetical protein G4G31_17140 [Massilia sp. Se16.2.3]